jgi:hypothetical protein
LPAALRLGTRSCRKSKAGLIVRRTQNNHIESVGNRHKA